MTPGSAAEAKDELRRKMDGALKSQSRSDLERRSRRILERLFEADFFRRARSVCFYSALPHEVQTAAMIDRALADGKIVLLPKTDVPARRVELYEIRDRARDLVYGPFSIQEPDPSRTRPAAAAEPDCVLVPGVAFDELGRRLGHGMGFYDRFLGRTRPEAYRAGLGFSFQLVPEVPVEPHDVRLDAVITD